MRERERERDTYFEYEEMKETKDRLNKERAQSIFLFIAGSIPLYTKILLITPNPRSKYFILMRLLFHNK